MKFLKLNRSKILVKGEELRIKLKGMKGNREDTAFLNGILTNDILNLKEGHFNYNLMLKQNGTPMEEFFVFNMGNSYLLDSDCPANKIIELLNKLKLSMRVIFEDVTESNNHYFVWGEGAEELVRELVGTVPEEGTFVVKDNIVVANNTLRLREIGFDIIGKTEEKDIKGERVTQEEYEDIRIKRRIPAIHKELREGFSPLEAGVEKYAISFTKGCYTGQEAIARVYYKGRLPRKLVLLRTEGKVTENEDILYNGEKVGIITSVSPISPLALGYINVKALENDTEFQTKDARLFVL